MKWLSALLLCVVVCAVSGELINVLHQLQESDAFHQLSVQDKVSASYSGSTQTGKTSSLSLSLSRSVCVCVCVCVCVFVSL